MLPIFLSPITFKTKCLCLGVTAWLLSLSLKELLDVVEKSEVYVYDYLIFSLYDDREDEGL